MTRSKYPPFERVAAGRLAIGDRILVRDNAADRLTIDGWDEHPWQDRPVLPTGIHTVTKVDTELHRHRRRASRYYVVWLDGFHPSAHTPLVCTVSSVQRWNRVTEEGA